MARIFNEVAIWKNVSIHFGCGLKFYLSANLKASYFADAFLAQLV